MRLFGLIGFPLSHSFSAQYFAKKFAEEQISDAKYQLFPLEEIASVSTLIAEQPDLQGLNITIPHKVSILPLLDTLTVEAAAVGAVNCIKIKRDSSGIKLMGYNTDVYGFRESLIPLLKPHHHNALVLGTGGASKAVCYILQEAGINFRLVSRTGEGVITLNYKQLTERIIKDHPLIINTTPVGMYPDTGKCPEIPFHFMSSKHLFYDLIYNPAETRFLILGRKAGADTMNGQKMLELQAEKSWQIWNSE
jgi:shikimate dehydrogenase